MENKLETLTNLFEGKEIINNVIYILTENLLRFVSQV